jgi:4-amino-4-deoxy-L-arabinose transferase-like glycosyltransferase
MFRIRLAAWRRSLPWLLFVLAFVHQVVWAHIIPPWQGPDEPRHFERLAQIAAGIEPGEPAALALQGAIIDSMLQQRFWRYGYAITPFDPARPPRVLDDIWPGYAHEAHQMPLYYALAAGIVRAAGGRDLAVQVGWVRLFSALLGAGVVLLAWASARTLFPERPGLALLISLSVALLPMHAFANATINNDNLAAFFTALQVFLAARALRFGLRWGEGLGMVACAGLAVITKRTGFIAPALLLATLAGVVWGRLRLSRRALAIIAGIAAATLIVACALRQTLLAAVAGLWAGFFHLPADVLEHLLNGDYALALLKTPYPYYTRIVFESFWARFGWLNVRLPDLWYVALGGVCLAAGAGLVWLGVRVWRRRAGLQPYQVRGLLVFIVTATLAYIIIIGKEVLFLSYLAGVVPQGRYLFPVVIPLMTLIVVGLDAWVPARFKRPAGVVAALASAGFEAICIFGYILPYYRA